MFSDGQEQTFLFVNVFDFSLYLFNRTKDAVYSDIVTLV